MNEKAFPIVIMFFGHIGISHNSRESGDELEALAQHTPWRQVFRIGVVGITGEHRASQFIHYIGGRSFHDAVFSKVIGQCPFFSEIPRKPIKLASCRKIPEHQKVDSFFVSISIFLLRMLHQHFDIDTAIVQFSIDGHAFAFIHDIAMNIANPRKPNDNAGTIGVSQPTLDIVTGVQIFFYFVIFKDFAEIILHIHRPLHVSVPGNAM